LGSRTFHDTIENDGESEAGGRWVDNGNLAGIIAGAAGAVIASTAATLLYSLLLH